LRISDFEWNEGNALHLELGHGIEPEEAEEAFASNPLFRRTKKGHYVVFGPTSEVFGFFPYSNKAIVLEDKSLSCRPCDIHGIKECKTGKRECLTNIVPELAFERFRDILKH